MPTSRTLTTTSFYG